MLCCVNNLCQDVWSGHLLLVYSSWQVLSTCLSLNEVSVILTIHAVTNHTYSVSYQMHICSNRPILRMSRHTSISDPILQAEGLHELFDHVWIVASNRFQQHAQTGN